MLKKIFGKKDKPKDRSQTLSKTNKENPPEKPADSPDSASANSNPMKSGMAKSRCGFISRMDSILGFKRDIDPELLDELEEVLVMADMGVATVQEIFNRLRSEVKRKELRDSSALRHRIRQYILEMLESQQGPSLQEKIKNTEGPFVILVVGVNGVGKTTTIAKMAHNFSSQGLKVLIGAADTFRAAAIDQLQEWGRRIDVPVIHHQPGADPSAVAFDAVEAGRSRGVDVVIVDTAGRLHTQVNLMEELKKIRRVISRQIPAAPHETLLVLDATTGQNALRQAKLFNEATDVTGIVLTKLDGTAKGGIAAGIVHEMQIPIRYIGLGEKMEDLRPFDSVKFVSALFD